MRQLKRLAPVVGLGAVLAGWAMVSGCGEDLVITVTVPPTGVRADGRTAADISIVAARGTTPVEGTVSISSSLGSFSMIDDPSSIPDDSPSEGSLSSGEYRAKLYSIEPGEARLTVRFVEQLVDGSSAPPITKNAVVTFGGDAAGKIAVLEFVSAEPESINLSGSGGTATSTVTFRAKDASGGAVEQGVPVKFALGAELGGARVDPAEAKTEPGGLVKTVLFAGTAPGTVRVKATAGSVTEESPPIAIAGRAANFRNFSVACDERSIGGFHRVGLTMNCTALVADRNTNKLAGVQVTFLSEAGAITPIATTDDQGNAVAEYKTQNPIPADVPPVAGDEYKKTGTDFLDVGNEQKHYAPLPAWMKNAEDNGEEPSWVDPEGLTCPTGQTCNPRDGLVTLIAVTAGEEEWNDRNNNGVWDEGEAFIDLPEPYVDVNDNGKFDASHPIEKDLYIDTNKNGRWDGPNGVWDGTTQIWRPVKFVWTGDVNGKKSGVYTAASSETKASSLLVPHCGASNFKVLVVDQNLNFLGNRAGDSLNCECRDGDCGVATPSSIGVHNEQFGRRFLGYTNVDNHGCEPDCKNDDPPCSTQTDQNICGGDFSFSSEGGAIRVDLSGPSVTVQ